MKKLLPLLVLCALALPARAAIDLETIKPDGFARGVVFTVAGYDANRSTLTNFPVLVRISEAGVSGFDYDDMMFAGADSSDADRDLCFVAADGTPLAYDIDTWDPDGTSLVWVKLPTMANGTEFAMFYRSSKSGKTVCGANPFSDYVGVWHLGEAGNGKQDILDAGPNGLAAKSSDMSVEKSDGQIGGARQITTTRAKADKAIKVTGTDEALAALNTLGTDFSVSFWVRPIGSLNNSSGDAIGYDGLIGRKSAKTTPAWAIQLTDNVKKVRFWTSQTTDSQFGITGEIFQFAKNVWGKIDVVYTYTTSGNQPRITAYWNGTKVYGPIAPWQGAVQAQGSLTLAIGGYVGSDERSFLGDMDEVRVGRILPTEDRVKADYDTANSVSFLTAGTVTEFVELPKPVAAFRLDDSGAAFAQFGGSISSLGGNAAAASVLVQLWPTAGTPSGDWTTLATGLDAGDSFEGIVTNLVPQTEYTYAIKAVNDLTPPYDSDVVTNTFTTSGAGEAGTGGDAKRVGDDIVHTFTVDPTEGDTWTFVPPSYATSVEALVVAGGGPGGYFGGAGGGAGGLLHYDALPVTGGATYTVKVGAGGVASSEATAWGTSGGNSLITSAGGSTTNAIAFGGGSGGNGNLDNQTATRPGVSGGSGGGSTDASYAAGSGTSGQGNAGGTGLCTVDKSRMVGAGGGGAGGIGGSVSAGNTVSGGSGGDGRELRISGVAAVYAAGGGGGGRGNNDGSSIGSPGSGGNGVGGNGGMFTVANAGTERASAGKDGTGSGGGGGSTTEGAYAGANGGSGVVIVRYPIQGDGTTMPNPAIALTSATHDKESNVVSFTYRVAWAGTGYQVADVGLAWGFSPDALTTTNPIATDKIGSGSGTVQLPNVSKTVFLRAVATNAGGYADDSVETAVFTLFNPDAPVGSISLESAAVTNATLAVEVTDFGTSATGASVTVEVCESDTFAGTVLSFPADGALAETGTVSVVVTGLSPNSAYFARAVVLNNRQIELTTDPTEFSTVLPGAPIGTAALTDIGFTTFSAKVRVSSFGSFAAAATVRIEASTSESFATLASVSDEVAATLNLEIPLTIAGLESDTDYYYRARILNDWNVTTYVGLPFSSTRSVPFVAAGPSWTASENAVDIHLVVSAVYDEARCSAVLTYGDEVIGTKTFDTTGDVTWSGVPAKADGTVATIVVTATVDEADYERAFSAPVTPGATATTVSNPSTHASAANALWMRPGDIAMLPDLFGAASYEVLNGRFARIDGSTLTALEPGIVGVRCVDASYVTNVMGVVILPDAIGEGSVYVFDETKWTDDSWTKASSWKKVDGATRTAVASNDSWPCQADDIAILPFYNRAGDSYMRHRTDITLGGLYTGMIRPDATASCNLERFKDVDTKTVTFQRTDGQPVRLQVCPNGFNGNYQSQLQFGGYVIDVVWASDAVIDCGSSQTDHVSGPVGTFWVKNMTTPCTNTLQGVTLTVRGLPGRYVNGAGSTREFNGIWKGTGTIVKEGQGGIVFHGDLGGFSGSFVIKGERNLGGMTVPATQLSLRGGGATNVSATVYGVVAVNSGNGAPTSNGGAGVFGTSTQVQAATPDRGPDAPAKGLSLIGGTWYAGRVDNKTWGVNAEDDKRLDYLAVGAGMSYIYLQPRQNSTDGYPINVVTAKELRQTERGTLAITDPSRYAASTATPSAKFYAENWEDVATGAAGACETESVHKVVPWILSSVNDGNWGNVAFATFDDNGRLVQEARENVDITAASSENANLYANDKNLNAGTAGGTYTVNSLWLANNNRNKWLGADRTLRIKSGGVILHGQSTSIGLPGRDDNGSLVLGDATHPAYVWAKAYNGGTNYIGAAVTAAGGFVSAYPGNLCLVGDQTGIADELAVNAGTLALGTSAAPCTIAEALPIRVCAGATLRLPAEKTLKKNPLKLDGNSESFGKVVLATDQACASLSIRNLSESGEWTTLPGGYYGSSEAAGLDDRVEFVRDDLFAGPGVLKAGTPAAEAATLIMVW